MTRLLDRSLLLLLAAALAAGCVTPPPPRQGGATEDKQAPVTTAPSGPAAAPAGTKSPAGAKAAPPVPAVQAPRPAVTRPADQVADAMELMRRVREAVSHPGQAESTLSLARDLAAALPAHPDSWILLGWAARNAQSPAVMTAAFKKAIDLDRSRTEALYALAEASAQAGSPLGAHDWLARGWKEDPGPESARRLASADISASRLDEARAVLSAARDAAPADEALTADLSAVLDMAGNSAHALSLLPFREAMPTRLLLARVSLQLRQGQLEGAAQDLEKALARDDAGNDATLLLGVLKMQRGDLPGAEEQFRKLAAAHPASPDGHLNLGLALRRQGRFTDAKAAYEAGIASADSADLHLNLGVLKELYLGDKAGAREEYRRFIEMGGAGADRVRGWSEYLTPATGSEADKPGGGKP